MGKKDLIEELETEWEILVDLAMHLQSELEEYGKNDKGYALFCQIKRVKKLQEMHIKTATQPDSITEFPKKPSSEKVF